MPNYLTALNMRVSTCTCGITWAAPERWFVERQVDHETFYCPNGCHRHFPQENETERLKRRLSAEQNCCIQAREEANAIERSCRAYKGIVTKLKKKLPTTGKS